MPPEGKVGFFSDRPDFTAALRQAVWIHSQTGRGFQSEELEQFVRAARIDMGMKPLKGGAAGVELQRRTEGLKLCDPQLAPHYTKRDGRRYPTPNAIRDWRFKRGHSHGEVRQVARASLLLPDSSDSVFRFIARGSYLPSLRVVIMSRERPAALQNHDRRRGLYILHRSRSGQRSNYIGQTTEIKTRWSQHINKDATHLLFAYPEEKGLLAIDALNVGESLAIAGFSDILSIGNDKLGHDQEPAEPSWKRAGSAMALAFQAAVIKWASMNDAG